MKAPVSRAVAQFRARTGVCASLGKSKGPKAPAVAASLRRDPTHTLLSRQPSRDPTPPGFALGPARTSRDFRRASYEGLWREFPSAHRCRPCRRVSSKTALGIARWNLRPVPPTPPAPPAHPPHAAQRTTRGAIHHPQRDPCDPRNQRRHSRHSCHRPGGAPVHSLATRSEDCIPRNTRWARGLH